MAVDIDSFKRDLEQLKNQRSVIQAKLDEANRRVAEYTETLKGMGFNSVDEAKQAYQKQMAEAESQHALVKQLMQEIAQVDQNVPTREQVMERLNALSSVVVPPQATVEVLQGAPLDMLSDVTSDPAVNGSEGSVPVTGSGAPDMFAEDSQAPLVESALPVQGMVETQNPQGVPDLGNMLFASL